MFQQRYWARSFRSATEHLGDSYLYCRVGGAEHPILRFFDAVMGIDKRAARGRIDYPDVLHAELKIIVDPVLHSAHAILRREHLHNEERRRGDDAAVRSALSHQAYVRDSKAPCRNLNSHLNACPVCGKMSA